jgi:hypothetical protein
MMHMQFVATSLEDIADYFDKQGEEALAKLDGKKRWTVGQRGRIAGTADAWKEAAVFLREVKLDPEHVVRDTE